MIQEIVLDIDLREKLLASGQSGHVEIKDKNGFMLAEFYIERKDGIAKLYAIEGASVSAEEHKRRARSKNRFTPEEVMARLRKLDKDMA